MNLWFISFTIGFGKGRVGEPRGLDWTDFPAILPPPARNVRVTPTSGLLASRRRALPAQRRPDNGRSAAVGFAFTTETAVPLSKLYLAALRPADPIKTGISVRWAGRA